MDADAVAPECVLLVAFGVEVLLFNVLLKPGPEP